MDRTSLIRGGRAAIPLSLAAFPFGLVYGVAVTESGMSAWLGAAASWIILAGASQLSLVSLIEADAAWPVAVGTALVINSRFALYSTALAPAFGAFPRRWRWSLPYLLTDQAASLAMVHFDKDHDPVRRRWWYLGAAVTFASGWWAGTVVGLVMGSSLPEQLDIAFAVPAMFIALLIPTIVSRPALVVALVAAAITVAAAPLPNGLNVIAGALGALVVGRLLVRAGTTS